MPLTGILIHKIQNEGPLSFHDFMEMAMYYPEEGYHTCLHENPFTDIPLTHPEINSVFVTLLARQLEEMWKLLDKKSFTIIEYGAGRGTLCKGICDYFSHDEELYSNLHYCIIEKSPAIRYKEKKALCEKAEWFNSIEEMPYTPDCILSNEVLKNFAVHEVVMQRELMEVYVDYKGGFVEVLRPASQELKDYLREMNVSLPPGYRTEINMDALQWLQKNAAALQKGFVLTIDHGFPVNEFFSLSRHRGNLLCYDKINGNELLYDTAGQKDITAHVNFTALHHWGRRYGLECCGYTSQAHFLHGLGLLRTLDHLTKNDCKEKLIQLYRKIMSLSTHFNILVQHKGIERPQLSGLHFAQTYV